MRGINSGAYIYSGAHFFTGACGSVMISSGPFSFDSGSVLSGQVRSGHFATAPLASGSVSAASPRKCFGCACTLSPFVAGNKVFVRGLSGLSVVYCWKCAGFSDRREGRSGGSPLGFEHPEEWIRASVPFAPDTPAGIIADYLRDQGLDKAADYMLGISKTTEGE